MTTELTIPVPATGTAWYLMRTNLAAEEAERFALRQVDDYAAGYVRRQVRELADTAAVRFGVLAEGERADLTAEQRELIRRADDWVSIRVQTPFSVAPQHEWVARTLAGLLADELGVPVADMTTACLQSADELLASLHAKENGITRMADWIRIASEYSEVGWVIATRGMRRYGLPELRVVGIPPWREDRWCALLTGIAFRVREEFVHAATPLGELPGRVQGEVRIPGEIGVSNADVADAYCLPGSFESRRYGWRWSSGGWLETLFGLAHDHGDLIVVPPPAGEQSTEEFLKSAGAENDSVWPALDAVGPFVTVLQKVHIYPQSTVFKDTLGDLDRM